MQIFLTLAHTPAHTMIPTNVKIWDLSHHPLHTITWSLLPNLTLGGMGKFEKYLYDISQPFTERVKNYEHVSNLVNLSHYKQKLWQKNWGTQVIWKDL